MRAHETISLRFGARRPAAERLPVLPPLRRTAAADLDPIVAAWPRPAVALANRERAERLRAAGAGGPDRVVIHLRGDISAATAARVRQRLAAAPGAKSWKLVINSPGGDVAAAMEIFQALGEHPAVMKEALVRGCCASAAVLPLMAGDVRRAERGAQMLLHRCEAILTDDGDRLTADILSKMASTTQRLDASIAVIIGRRSGAATATIAAEMADERPLPLPKAIRLGILHEIIEATS